MLYGKFILRPYRISNGEKFVASDLVALSIIWVKFAAYTQFNSCMSQFINRLIVAFTVWTFLSTSPLA